MQQIKPPKKIPVTPQLNQETAEWVDKYYPTKYKGAQTTLEAMPQLFLATIAEIKGIFSKGELSLIIDVMNGVSITPQIMGRHVLANVSDAMALDDHHKKWDVEKTTMTNKLSECTIFQKATLEIWAVGFWEGAWNKGYSRTEEEFSRWLDILA